MSGVNSMSGGGERWPLVRKRYEVVARVGNGTLGKRKSVSSSAGSDMAFIEFASPEAKV